MSTARTISKTLAVLLLAVSAAGGMPVRKAIAAGTERIAPGQATLSNLEPFKEQIRRDLPAGTPKNDVEVYLTQWKIPYQFYGPNIALRSSRNTFYVLIEDLGPWAIDTLIYMAKLQIQIHLDDDAKVRDIEFRLQY